MYNNNKFAYSVSSTCVGHMHTDSSSILLQLSLSPKIWRNKFKLKGPDNIIQRFHLCQIDASQCLNSWREGSWQPCDFIGQSVLSANHNHFLCPCQGGRNFSSYLNRKSMINTVELHAECWTDINFWFGSDRRFKTCKLWQQLVGLFIDYTYKQQIMNQWTS